MTFQETLAAKGKRAIYVQTTFRTKEGNLAYMTREKIVDLVVEDTSKVKSKMPKVKVQRVRAAKGNSKLDQARKIYENAANTQSRYEIIQLFMSQLSMSKAGATTYFYNVKR